VPRRRWLRREIATALRASRWRDLWRARPVHCPSLRGGAADVAVCWGCSPAARQRWEIASLRSRWREAWPWWGGWGCVTARRCSRRGSLSGMPRRRRRRWPIASRCAQW